MAALPPGRRALVVLLTLVAVSAIALPATGAVDSSQQQSGEEILDRVEQRYGEAETVTGSAVVITSNASETVESNVSFAYASPDSHRVVVERDNETYRTGSNGTIGWAVGPEGTAVWDADGPEAPATGLGSESDVPGNESALAWAFPTDVDTEDLDVTLVGETEIDGTPAYELDLFTDDDETNVTTLWVAQDDSRVLQAATTTQTSLTVVDVQEVQFDVDVHESTFQPPEERLDSWAIDRYDSFEAAQDATDLDLPQFDDGTFEEATVTTQGDETVVSQQYVVDGENVTLVSATATDQFEAFGENGSQVDIDGQNASVTGFEDDTAVVWTEDDVTTAVVVEGSTDRAVEIAGQVSE